MSFCGNCGSKLDENIKFCQGCGQKVDSEFMGDFSNTCAKCGEIIESNSEDCPYCGFGSVKTEETSTEIQNKSINIKRENAISKLKNIVPEVIVPCEGEQKVKQYHCTHLKSKLLGLKAEGVLQITNKRAIFRASGKSITGNSIIQSEVPIEDISGISIYKGTYFSLKHFILALLLFLLINPIFTAVLGVFSFANQDVASVLQWIFAVGGVFGAFAIPRKYIWNSMLGGLSTICFFMIAGGSFISGIMGGSMFSEYGSSNNMAWVAIFAVIMLVYTLIALFLYARRLTMSLSIGSKGGSSTPIYISGASSFGFANSAAPKAIEAEPTEETEMLIKELGAMIMDIQKMGDYGIEKWICK